MRGFKRREAMKKFVPGGYFLVIAIVLAIIFYLTNNFRNRQATIPVTIDTVATTDPDSLKEEIPKKMLYGIIVDSLDVQENTIRPNQFLGEILAQYNVSGQEIHELSQKAKPVYDVRKIVSRKKYTVISTADSIKKAQYLIYEPNNLEYVVYKLKDSIEVYRELKKIDTVENRISGIISTSLWETMREANADPELIHSLSEVFAWQVDFYRVQKGDKFKVIFEQLMVEDEPVGIGKILGAYFNHFGEDYYGVYFDQGDAVSYFDEKGESLQKQFLRAPLRYNRISSRYTRRRYHPLLKRYRSHLGTDYAAPTGTPIHSVGDGVVMEARYAKYNGRYVKIRHNSVYTTQYLHMSQFAKGIKTGVKVKQGQVIGYVGSTGLANGPHLCFRFWKHNQQVDALKIELPPSEPVREELRQQYEIIKDRMIDKLNKIHFQNEIKETFAASKQY